MAFTAVGFVAITAARGPWAPIAIHLYSIPAFDFFRDPYNFAMLVQLGIVIAFAAGVTSRPALLFAGVLLVNQLWAFMFGFTALPRTQFSISDEAVLTTIAQSKGYGRVLYLPMGGRLVNGGNLGSEYWPPVVGSHPVLNTYYDEGIDLSVERNLKMRRFPASKILSAAGIEWVVDRKDLHSERDVQIRRDVFLRIVRAAPDVVLYHNDRYMGRALSPWPCAPPILFSDVYRGFNGQLTPCSRWSLPARVLGENRVASRNWASYRGDNPGFTQTIDAGISAAVSSNNGIPYPLPKAGQYEVCAAGQFAVVDAKGTVPLRRDGKCDRLMRSIVGDGYLKPDGQVLLYGFRAIPHRFITTTVSPIELTAEELRADAQSLVEMRAGPNVPHGSLLVSDRSGRYWLGGFWWNIVPLAAAIAGWLITCVLLARALLKVRTETCKF